MNSLALLVQEAFGRDRTAAISMFFRGKSGKLIKILWHDGLGMPPYAGARPLSLAIVESSVKRSDGTFTFALRCRSIAIEMDQDCGFSRQSR